jgi:hypothetical protein
MGEKGAGLLEGSIGAVVWRGFTAPPSPPRPMGTVVVPLCGGQRQNTELLKHTKLVGTSPAFHHLAILEL